MKTAGMFLCGAVFGIVAILAACSSGNSTTASSSTASSSTTANTSVVSTSSATASPEAKALYVANCAPCHGDKQQGVSGLGPALTPQQLGGKADADIRAVIANGKPGTVMSAWSGRLTSQQIDALVTFMKTAP